MLFRPNLQSLVSKRVSTNVYGEESLSTAVSVPCAIIYLRMKVSSSGVRADSSASRGAAREYTGEAKILFPATTDIDLDDQIEVSGYKLRIVSIFPRHNLRGVLDHYEIEASAWGKQ